MAAADEMAWEPRLPWIHPAQVRWRLRGRPSAQPVPERFEIVVADLLATLTFDPVLGPNPRTRLLARRPTQTSTIFDPVSSLAPLVWEPTLPTGTRRTQRERRRSLNQSSLDPTSSGVLAAQLLTWLPTLPTRTTRRVLRPRATGAVFELEFSVLAAGEACTELTGEALTSPGLTSEQLTAPAFLTEALTAPALLNEEAC